MTETHVSSVARRERSRGFGFVTLLAVDDAADVIRTLTGTRCNDRPITVNYAVKHSGSLAVENWDAVRGLTGLRSHRASWPVRSAFLVDAARRQGAIVYDHPPAMIRPLPPLGRSFEYSAVPAEPMYPDYAYPWHGSYVAYYPVANIGPSHGGGPYHALHYPPMDYRPYEGEPQEHMYPGPLYTPTAHWHAGPAYSNTKHLAVPYRSPAFVPGAPLSTPSPLVLPARIHLPMPARPAQPPYGTSPHARDPKSRDPDVERLDE